MLDKPNHPPAHSIAQSIVQDRHDLAAALRLAAHFEFHEGIENHFRYDVTAEMNSI